MSVLMNMTYCGLRWSELVVVLRVGASHHLAELKAFSRVRRGREDYAERKYERS